MFKLLRFPFLFAVVLLPACQPAASADTAASADNVASGGNSTMELVVDGNTTNWTYPTNADKTQILMATYIDGRFALSALGAQKDVQFVINCKPGPLQAGAVYRVHDCSPPSVCSSGEYEGMAAYTPYPTDKPAVFGAGVLAMNAPELGLPPLELRIASVTDEVQPGNFIKMKRVTGTFEGRLARVAEIPTSPFWQIKGKATSIKGKFNIVCMIR